MSIEFVAGRAGSGKSRYVMSRIREWMQNPLQEVIVIVPEQYTFQTERDILEKCKKAGFIGLNVLSFKKLVYHILEETGGRALKSVNLAAKSMMVRLALQYNINDLKAFKKSSSKNGFDLKMAELLSEIKRYDIGADVLLEKAADLNLPYLREKTLDIACILKEYEKQMQGRCDMEDLINLAIKNLEESNLFSDAYLIIDGFDMLTGQIKRLIRQMMKRCKRSIITFKLPEENAPDTQLFSPEEEAFSEFYSFANSLSEKKMIKRLPDADFINRHTNSELSHLEKNLYAYPYKPYKEDVKALSLFAAKSRTGEVLYAVENILKLVREKGMRFRDIAVLTDLPAYSDLIKSVFTVNGIPCFVDGKRKLIKSNPAVLIDSALCLFTGRWNLNDLTRHIKTGLTNITEDEADMLLNFQKENGLRGYAFKKPFKRADETLEAIRQKLVDPLLELENEMKDKSASFILDAVQNYLDTLSIPDKISVFVKELEAAGLDYEAQFYAQTVEKINGIFSQAKEILSSHVLSLYEIKNVLGSGFESVEIAVVPPAVDEVTVGDIKRSKLKDIKALFVLGLNEGVIPAYTETGGIVTEDELICYHQNGIQFGRLDKTGLEKLSIYSALSKPKETLFLSYALNVGGASTLVDKIKRIFPMLKLQTDLEDNAPLRILGAEGTFRELSGGLRKFLDGRGEPPNLKSVLSWYMQNGYKEKLEALKNDLLFENDGADIGETRAKDLFGGLRGSVSRIEEYYACPYRHFIKYGLKAKEVKEFSDNKTDAGSLMHGAIDRFTKKLKVKNLRWQDADDGQIEELLKEAINESASSAKGFMDDRRLLGVLERYRSELMWSVKAIRWQLAGTDVSVYGSEIGFGLKDGLPAYTVTLDNGEKATIVGCVDRADILKTPEGKFLRIVDYKLSDKKLDYGEYAFGLQIQLIVYLMVLVQYLKSGGESLKPAGAYYFSFALPSLSEEDEKDKDAFLKKRMQGISADAAELIKNFGNLDENRCVRSICLKVNKDGCCDKNSQNRVFAEKDFEGLFQYTENLIKNALKGIFSGKAEVSPSVYRQRTCDFCKYLNICRFDESYAKNTVRKVKKKNKAELLETIREAKV